MNPREQKELAASKLLLVVLAIIGLAVVIWLAWVRPSPHAVKSAEQAAVPQDVKTKTPEQLKPPKDEQKYLVITEWGVRAPLGEGTEDMVYTYQPLEGDSVAFTFKRLQTAGICDPSAGVSMTRSTTSNQPPYTVDNPEPIAKVGEYSYYLAYAGEPCTATANQTQKDVANAINNGDITAAVRTTLQKLQAN